MLIIHIYNICFDSFKKNDDKVQTKQSLWFLQISQLQLIKWLVSVTERGPQLHCLHISHKYC